MAETNQQKVTRIAQEEGLDPDLALRVASTESNFNSNAVSPKGALGLMQVMPATYTEVMGKDSDPSNVDNNVRAGLRYLGKQLKDFNGDVPLSLAAYNAGAGAVKKYGGIPPYKETQNYVRKIMANSNPAKPDKVIGLLSEIGDSNPTKPDKVIGLLSEMGDGALTAISPATQPKTNSSGDKVVGLASQLYPKEMPVQAPAATNNEATFGEKVTDNLIAAEQGFLGAAKSVTDVFGANNAVSTAIDNSSKAFNEFKSDEQIANEKRAQAIDESTKNAGMVDSVVSMWEQIKANPTQISTVLGGMIPYAIGGAQTAVAKTAMGLLGIAQGLGDTKGQEYAKVYSLAKDAGYDEQTRVELATKAQEYGAKNLTQHAFGAVLGFIDAKRGIEISIGKVTRGVPAGNSRIGSAIKDGFGEAAISGAQGSQGAYAGNVAAVDAGLLAPEQALDGVATRGFKDATLGAVIGAPFGALQKPENSSIPQTSGQRIIAELKARKAAQQSNLDAAINQNDLLNQANQYTSNQAIDASALLEDDNGNIEQGNAGLLDSQTATTGLNNPSGSATATDNGLDGLRPSDIGQAVSSDLTAGVVGERNNTLTPKDNPTPEPQVTLDAQIQAFVTGNKPALLITPGEVMPANLPNNIKTAEIPNRGTLVYRDDASLQQALNGNMGEALGYGINEKPAQPTTVVTARDANGTVIQDVATDGRQSVIDAAKQVAGNGTVEMRPIEAALAERQAGVDAEAGFWQAKSTELSSEFNQLSNNSTGSGIAFLAGGNLSKGAKTKLNSWQNRKSSAAGQSQIAALGAKFESGEAVDAESIISIARLNLPNNEKLDSIVNSPLDLAIVAKELLGVVNKPQANKIDFNIKTNNGKLLKITSQMINNYLKPSTSIGNNVSLNTKNNPANLESETPISNVKKPKKRASNPTNLLQTIKSLGGINAKEFKDVMGESKLANAGYNRKAFNTTSRFSLNDHITDGSLDIFLPPNLRSLNYSDMGQDFDPAEARNYLADLLASGERNILPYDVREEIKNNAMYERYNGSAERDIETFAELYTDDEINSKLRAAGYDEREAITDAQEFEDSQDDETESQPRSTQSSTRATIQEPIPKSPDSDTVGREGTQSGNAREENPKLDVYAKTYSIDTSSKRVDERVKDGQVTRPKASQNSTNNSEEPSKQAGYRAGQNSTDLLGENTQSKQAIADAEKLAFKNANKELERLADYDIQEVLSNIANGNGGADIAELAKNSKYWDSENEQLTDDGYAEYDRLNLEYAKEKAGEMTIESIEDLDNAHHFAQSVAMESLLDGLGVSYSKDYSFSTSRYLNIKAKNDETIKVRFANHANTAKGMGNPDYNIAPDVMNFSEAWDEILEKIISPASTSDFKDGSPIKWMQERQAVRADETGSLEELAQQDAAADVSNVSNNKTKSNTDLLGDNTKGKQAIADATRAKDAKRNTGTDNASDFNLSGSDSEADKAIASGAQALFSRSAMKSVDANIQRGEASMNEALISKADVKRAMYHNELGWVDFVWGNELKGIQHIVKQRLAKDNLTTDEIYKLLTKNLVETIATGKTLRSTTTDTSSRVVIQGINNEAVLVKTKGSNGWLLTGYRLNEQVNQSGGATASDLRSNDPIRSRVNEGAAQLELSNLARSGLQLSSLAQARSSNGRIYRDSDLVKYRADNQSKFSRSDDNQEVKVNDDVTTDKASQASVDKLNRAMVRNFNDDTWSNAYEPADMLSPIADLAEAATTAFGSQITAIKPTSERFNILNGINLGGRNYINIDRNIGFINIVGHELGHDLKNNRPDLYAFYKQNAKKHLKDFGKYHKKLNGLVLDGEQKYTSDNAMDELLNDFMGDALADPVFVAELAKASPSKFKDLLKTVTAWLKDVANKLTKNNLGSSQYFSDVEALRKHLNRVLFAYASNKSIAEMTAPSFSRSDAKSQTDTPAFKKWFGDSKVVDKDGQPLVVYHGTNADFNEFDINAEPVNYESDRGKQFFLDDPAGASEYAEGTTEFVGEGNANVLPVYLRIENPRIEKISGSPSDWWDNQPDYMWQMNVAELGFDGLIVRSKDQTMYVTSNPSQIKSAIGNNGNFDGNNNDIRFSRAQAPLTPDFEIPQTSKLDNVLRSVQDKNIDLKRVTANIKKAVGDISDNINAYLQEELYHGRAAKRTQDFLNNELNPLITAMQTRGVTMADLEEYLWARHAEERNNQIAKVNPAMPDGGSGLTTQEANDYLNGLTDGQKRNFDALAKRVDAITKGSRQVLVDYNLESAGTVLAMEGAYKNYVPLMREDMDMGFGMGTGQGFSVKGNSGKRATGSKRAVVDILANIAQQRERNIIRGEKNRVSTALVGLAKLNPNADFWAIDTPPKVKSVSKVTGLVEEYTDPNYKNRNNVVVARIADKNGNIQERAVVFNERNERAVKMALNLKNLDQDQIGVVLSNAAVITRYFSSINTQYNPMFGVVNIMRDVQGALLNLSSTPLKGMQPQVLAETAKTIGPLYKEIRAIQKTGKSTNSDVARLYEDFATEGGKTGYQDMFRNAEERGKAIKKTLDPKWWQQTKLGKVVSVNGLLAAPEQLLMDKAVKPLFDWLSDYNEALENTVRLATYKVGLDKGLSKQQAASVAKNISVNFNRKGTVGAQVGSLYAFFNASVQGSARIAETLMVNDNGKLSLSKTGTKIISGGLLLGAMQAIGMAMAGFDDEEPPEFVRDRNIIIPTASGKYIAIPMPLGFNAIPAFGRIMTEWALSGGENTGERVVHMMDVLLNVTNPIGNAGLSIQTIAPTLIDPLVALTENKDFAGRPIAKKDFSSKNPTPGYTRARDNASAIGTGVAYFVNSVTGGNKYTEGAISPTPDQIDYLIGQAAGGVGREGLKIQTAITSLANKEEIPNYKIPLVGKFYGNAKNNDAERTAYYNNIVELNKLEGEYKGRAENADGLAEFKAENPLFKAIALANGADKYVTKLTKQRRKLQEMNAPDSKIKLMNELIARRMKTLNEAVRKIEAEQ